VPRWPLSSAGEPRPPKVRSPPRPPPKCRPMLAPKGAPFLGLSVVVVQVVARAEAGLAAVAPTAIGVGDGAGPENGARRRADAAASCAKRPSHQSMVDSACLQSISGGCWRSAEWLESPAPQASSASARSARRGLLSAVCHWCATAGVGNVNRAGRHTLLHRLCLGSPVWRARRLVAVRDEQPPLRAPWLSPPAPRRLLAAVTVYHRSCGPLITG